MFPAPRLLTRPDTDPAAGEVLCQDPAVYTPMPAVSDAVARPDESAAALALLDPDAGSLGAVNSKRLSDAGLIDALIASERLLASVAAKQQEFLAELASRDPDGERYLRDEAACALKIAPGTAVQRLDEAVELTGRLFDTHELVTAGVLSPQNARILARAVLGLPDEIALKVQQRVLPRECRGGTAIPASRSPGVSRRRGLRGQRPAPPPLTHHVGSAVVGGISDAVPHGQLAGVRGARTRARRTRPGAVPSASPQDPRDAARRRQPAHQRHRDADRGR
jgi:hypothetical protein